MSEHRIKPQNEKKKYLLLKIDNFFKFIVPVRAIVLLKLAGNNSL